MTVTKQQFNYLNEIGIKLLQQRNTSSSPEVSLPDNTSTPQVTPLPIDSNTLTQHVLFMDILQSIDISIGEVAIDNNVINLGLFNWQFIETESITFTDSTLSTPVITAFENNTSLKINLWKTIQQEVLT
jgi:hypothetical protein